MFFEGKGKHVSVCSPSIVPLRQINSPWFMYREYILHFNCQKIFLLVICVTFSLIKAVYSSGYSLSFIKNLHPVTGNEHCICSCSLLPHHIFTLILQSAQSCRCRGAANHLISACSAQMPSSAFPPSSLWVRTHQNSVGLPACLFLFRAFVFRCGTEAGRHRPKGFPLMFASSLLSTLTQMLNRKM